MTFIRRLSLTHCRHFETLCLEPCFGLNLITGPNASGKTTILEAIYVLAHGKSFRASVLDHLIKEDQKMMTLFSDVAQMGSDLIYSKSAQLGLQKIKDEPLKLHLDQEIVRSIKLFAENLPVQLITTESARFFTDGPKLRRDFLAWGLFYTNAAYYKFWKQYQRALAQRNQCLKYKLPISDLKIWDIQLIEAAERLDGYYQAYLKVFEPELNAILKDFLPDLDLKLHYDRGWQVGISLQEALSLTLDKSYALGYTLVGPHRLDLQLYVAQKEVQNVLSRGQLKLSSYALSLAQGVVLKKLSHQSPIYLIDDLSAELDKTRQGLVLQILKSLNSQVFVTSIEPLGYQMDFQSQKSFSLVEQ